MKTEIDALIDSFDLGGPSEDGSKLNGAPITFWIPASHKAKYELLQNHSKKKFAKLIKEVIKQTIDATAARLGVDKAS